MRQAVCEKKRLIVLRHKEVNLTLSDLDQALPRSIISLLKVFENVQLEKILNGCQPLWEIEHKIDFIPGATIPNRPAYRSHSEETKELKFQVEELLAKGYVRESLSLCVVPILLVPKKDGS